MDTSKRFLIGIFLSILTMSIYWSNMDACVLTLVLISVNTLDICLLTSQIIQIDVYKPNSAVYVIILAIYSFVGTNMLTYWYHADRYHALTIITTVTISDIMQYYLGKHFGNIRIGFPSPNKTLEGYFSGSIFAIIISSLILQISPYTSTRLIIWGILGDLFVSIFKRLLGVKDISSLLGSHGGYLDRVDGIYMAYIIECIINNIY